MKSFEYNFNPQTGGVFFDSFSYEPENGREKNFGSLYMVGILKSALPQDQFFLSNLAKKIRESVYASRAKNAELALNEGLQQANQHLERLVKEENVSWLGNLSFAVFGIKDKEIHFTKTGDIKISLLRSGSVIDLEEGIDFPAVQTCPLKVFGNLAIGKLELGDTVMAATSEIAKIISRTGMDEALAGIIAPGDPNERFSEKKMEELFNAERESLGQTPGACLLISLRKDLPAEPEGFSPAPYLKKMSLRDTFNPTLGPSKKIKAPSLMLPSVPKVPLLKTGVLILAVSVLAAGGWLFVKNEKNKQAKALNDAYFAIEKQISTAKSYQSEGNVSQASSIMAKSLADLSALSGGKTALPEDLKARIASLAAQVKQNLDDVNKVETGRDLQPVLTLDGADPKYLMTLGGAIYLFDEKSGDLFCPDKDNVPQRIAGRSDVALAASADNFLLFYVKPNQLVYFKNDAFSKPIALKEPYAGYNFDAFYSYADNLYFTDKTAGKIVKYPNVGGTTWGLPQIWLSDKPENLGSVVSIAFDKSAWFLKADGSIDKYYLGKLEQTIKPSYFPKPGQPSKIVTSARNPYLCVLDSNPARVIVLDKNGVLIKQIESDKFIGLKDMAVSDDGKTVWVLSGLSYYQINLSE
jgi:hypothetical protein